MSRMLHAAVLGRPIAHSLSPVMHQAAYAALGLGQAWDYGRYDVGESELVDFVAGLDEQWRGLSLTMPLKEAAFEVAAPVEEVAQTVGAINTLVRLADGGWSGHNTDVHGVRAALAAQGIVSCRRALVLGSGATGRSALHALTSLGCHEVTFAVRDQARPDTLAYTSALQLDVRVVSLAAVPAEVDDHDLVVNTLPGSAADAVAARLDRVVAGNDVPLLEVIYENWPTPLARTFAAGGAVVVSGLEMLAHQAAEQVRLMTGHEAPAEVMLDAAWAAVGGRPTLV